MSTVRHDDALARIDRLLEILAAGGSDPDGPGDSTEGVDQLAHGLQCAHELALQHPDDEELQVAGLLHDIGHQLVPGDDAGHGVVAAAAVRTLLGGRVATLIAHHVPAKRYLVATDASYAAILSPTSVRTLANQGGQMAGVEIARYEALPYWQDGLVLRRADDAAKVPGRLVPDLSSWRPVLVRVATGRRVQA